MIDIFTLSSDALPHGTRVVGFRGAEGLSRLFSFEIHLTLPAGQIADFELEGAIGASAALVLDRRDGRAPFTFRGIFSEVALVHVLPDSRGLVRALLVPRLWRLTQTRRSRIFTQQTLPQILEATLNEGGLTSRDYDLRLTQQYAPEEHVCQYAETLFDFISRWMEREGLYYWFEHGDEGEKLVVADAKAAHHDLPPAPIRFFALNGHDASSGECLETFVCRQKSLPAEVRIADYDYAKPALDVAGHASASTAGIGALSTYGLRVFSPEGASRLARIRAEELRASERLVTAAGTAFYLRAGYTFALTDHPRTTFDASYLVTEVEHLGNQSAATAELRQLTGIASDDVYRVHLTAIPASTQFRAPQHTPWPRIYGTEHGFVDGEAESEYAQLDDHGRYLVRFAFDESELGPGKASTRVRMMQPHGGTIEGWHFPLRKGTEVLLTFLGGDPDRPVIAGVVPNTITPSPVTKANHTRNVIQTGGRNRLELDDKRGAEWLTLSTPFSNAIMHMGSPMGGHEVVLRTDGSTLLEFGRHWDVTVGGNLREEVAGTTDEEYTGDHTTQSWARRTIEIAGVYVQNAHADAIRHVYGNASTTVDGEMTTTVARSKSEAVAQGSSEAVGAAKAISVTGGFTISVGGDMTTTVGGSHGESVGAVRSITAGSKFSVQCGGGSITVDSGGMVVIHASDMKIEASGEVDIEAGSGVKVTTSGPVTVKGSVVKLN